MSTMPPNVKNVVVEEREGSWLDHSASNSFIDLDISLDLPPSQDFGRRTSSSSHRAKVKDSARNGNAWGEANELQSNLHIEVGDRSFHLHKFPLISKSGKLNRLVFELRDPGKDRIALHDMPGGADTFEMAMRFLYNGKANFPLTSGNVAALRCAAEFLEMNDSLGDGSLMAKTEQYLNMVVVGSWKDSIAVLRACSDLKPWAEELEIVRRCSESVAWKASTDPHGLRWSYSKSAGGRDAPRGWWFDDACSLQIDTFTKVINALIAKGVDHTMVAAVMVQYAEKWLGLTKDSKTLNLHDSPKSNGSVVGFTGFNRDGVSKAQSRNRTILQGIVSLLPAQPDSVSCKFLLKLLRAACAVNAGQMCKTDLARRIGVKLDKVTVDELLIPAHSAAGDAGYDIDVVQQIVEHYLLEQNSGTPPLSPTSSSGGQSSISGATSTTSVSSVTTSSSSDRSSSTTGSRSSISGTTDSRSSISGTTDSRSSISTDSRSSISTDSRSSVSGTTDSRSSITRSSVSGTSVSGSGTSISRTTSGMSESLGSDDSATTGTTSSSDDDSVKLDGRFEKSKFFSTEGPTRRPQLPPTASNLKVARLLETFLEEVAKDSSISIGKFVALADLFLEFPRESDDCVYRAIDTFLRSHSSLNDQDRRRLCKVMDIQALSVNACMHAASNERLPLRVVVQVLFTEQVKLRNAITGTAVVNDKGVGSMAASFSSSASRNTGSYSDSGSSDPLLSSNRTETSTTSLSNSTTTGTTSSGSLSIHSIATSAAPSAAPSAVSSLMPGGLTVKDTLQGALAEIELLRAAVQEIDLVKARLGFMDVLHHEMENLNHKFMDLAHDYMGMTHQVEELTKASKHKGGWTSGWKKMGKLSHNKDHPELQKGGYHPTLLSEKHLKAAVDTMPLYQPMNIVHPTDLPLLQHPKTTQAKTSEPTKATATAVSRIPEAKVETPMKVIVMPKTEQPSAAPKAAQHSAAAAPKTAQLPAAAPQPADPRAATSAPPEAAGPAAAPKIDNNQLPRPSFSKDQPPRHSVSKDETARRSVSETPRNSSSSAQQHQHQHHKHHKHHKHSRTPEPHGGHQSRSKQRSRTPQRDSDSVSVSSSDYSYSSAHSNPRGHRHRDTSSSHRSDQDRSSHRSHSHHKTQHRPRHASRSRSPEPDHHHRRRRSSTHYTPDEHRHSNATAPTSSASNHKPGSDYHHSKPRHRSQHKHHQRKDYDSASSYSSDSGSPRPSKPRRHSLAM